jgi:PKD domain/RTX calcium-binding nonapeptide repeat (4 copies)/WD40-like Beta Propeller Repeat
MTRGLTFACLVIAVAAALPPAASAVPAGRNGWIAFDRGSPDSDLYRVAPGLPAMPLGGSVAGANDARPSWAPPPRFSISQLDRNNGLVLYLNGTQGEITEVTVSGVPATWTQLATNTIQIFPVPGTETGPVCVARKDPILHANPDTVVRIGIGAPWTLPDCFSQPVAFQSDRSGDYDIWAYDPALPTGARNPVNLTRSPGVHDTAPAWSPVADRDSTSLQVSPDRDRPLIAFESDRAGNRDIWVLDPGRPLAADNPLPLTSSPADDANPEWSPTGSHLAFESDRDGQKDIYTLRVERRPRPEIELRKLTEGQPPGFDPTWWMSESTKPYDPDPSASGPPSVIFYSGDGEAGDCELSWMEAYSTLLPEPDPDRAYVLPRPGSDEDAPALAPLTGDLAYQSGGNLFLLTSGKADGATPLTTGPGPDRHAAWQSLDFTAAIVWYEIRGRTKRHKKKRPGGASARVSQTGARGCAGQPVARFDASSARPGEPVLLDASASSDAAGGRILRYEWDLDGNGAFDASTAAPTLRHTYATPGRRNVVLRVVDDEGASERARRAVDVGGGSVDRCTERGTPGDDVLRGTPGRDVMCGLGGDDVLYGEGGRDVLEGGTGADRLRGGAGHDRLVGGAHVDVLIGAAGDDRLGGGAGHDRLNGEAGKDRLSGGAGKDRLVGGAGADRLSGGGGKDRMVGGRGRDRLVARDGVRDRVAGGKQRDWARVDAGLDRVRSVERRAA